MGALCKGAIEQGVPVEGDQHVVGGEVFDELDMGSATSLSRSWIWIALASSPVSLSTRLAIGVSVSRLTRRPYTPLFRDCLANKVALVAGLVGVWKRSLQLGLQVPCWHHRAMTATDQQFSLFDLDLDPVVEDRKSATTPSGRFSNFIVYVDESGDHGMQTVDPNYPLFVLAFCVFYKKHYSEKVVPALEKFKFNHFGHDIVILHEREIRKETGPFKFANEAEKLGFIDGLSGIIDNSNFILISCVIDKHRLGARDVERDNPYHLALGFCLETLYEFLIEKNQDAKKTHVVFECRGEKEDKDLELEFRRICDGENKLGTPLPFEIIFADKKANSSGLQLADLVARPIGMSVLRPEQDNRAFEVLTRKFYCDGGRENVGTGCENWGLKLFPPQISEKPR